MLKLISTFLNLSISNLSTSHFKLTKSNFLANFDVSTPAVFFESASVAYLDKSNSTFIPHFDYAGSGSGKYLLIFTMSFLLIQLLKELS